MEPTILFWNPTIPVLYPTIPVWYLPPLSGVPPQCLTATILPPVPHLIWPLLPPLASNCPLPLIWSLAAPILNSYPYHPPPIPLPQQLPSGPPAPCHPLLSGHLVLLAPTTPAPSGSLPPPLLPHHPQKLPSGPPAPCHPLPPWSSGPPCPHFPYPIWLPAISPPAPPSTETAIWPSCTLSSPPLSAIWPSLPQCSYPSGSLPSPSCPTTPTIWPSCPTAHLLPHLPQKEKLSFSEFPSFPMFVSITPHVGSISPHLK